MGREGKGRVGCCSPQASHTQPQAEGQGNPHAPSVSGYPVAQRLYSILSPQAPWPYAIPLTPSLSASYQPMPRFVMPHATPYTPPTVSARAPPSKVVCVLGYRRECRIYGSLDPGVGQASHANVSDPCFFKVLNSGPRADLESIMADLVEPIRAQPHRLEAHAPLPQLS